MWLLIAAGAVLLLAVVSAAIVGPSVWSAARDGRTALTEGSAAIVRRDPDAARVEFEAARELFATADSRLSSPTAWPLRAVPIVARHSRVASSLARVGAGIADAGIAVSGTMDDLPDRSLALRDGQIDLGAVRRAANALDVAVERLPRIEQAIDDMPAGWVSDPLRGPRDEAAETLPAIIDGVRKAQAALEGLPSILGDGGPKRYLIAFSNLAELRGSGGLFGYVTSLRAQNGRIELESFSGRPTEILPSPGDVGLEYPEWFPGDFREQGQIFQNVNMSSDFPTVGGFVVRTAEPEAGELDGVIAVDPVGIGAILDLVGPIRVPAWPDQIDASNVREIAMHDVYVDIPQDERREAFFEQLVRTAFERLTSATVRLEPRTVGSFDLAVRGAHFRMYSEHEDDQETFHLIGAAGGVDRAADATDVLSVISQNATGNKGDWYLQRDIRFAVRLDPDAGTAKGDLQVTFRNTAPSVGLPDYIVGSPVPGLERGTNRQIVVIVRSPTDRAAPVFVDGRQAVKVEAAEGRFKAYHSAIDTPPQGKSTFALSSRAPDAFTRDGDRLTYRLHVMRQATAKLDLADIRIEAPAGWRLEGRQAFIGDLTQDVVLEVELSRTVRGSIVDRLFVAPFRAAKDLVGRIF